MPGDFIMKKQSKLEFIIKFTVLLILIAIGVFGILILSIIPSM